MKINTQLKALRLLAVLAFMFCLSAGKAQAQSASVTLKVSDAPLEQVLETIEQQTTYLFVYDKNVDVTRKVSINVSNASLKSVLSQLFASMNITYAIENTSIVLSVTPQSASQQSGLIKGVVVDTNGVPVIGAAVVVKGTTQGVSTDVNGAFTLQVPPPVASAILTVDYLGYTSVDVPVGSKTDFKIVLAESAVSMDKVVVTALGIKRSEKALSYNVQQVNASDIVANKDANFINSLNGKVAGVTINASSAGVGGATKVVMRGQKSISQTSNALYVIDGVPMFTSARDSGTEFQSQGSADPIADINPEDIESLSVLNGAAAAALYGSDAANGAIVVTTKKGQAGFTTVTVTSNTEVSTPFILPEFQNRYGTGDLNSSVPSLSRSWGQRLNSSNDVGYDPRNDYFQAGVTGTETVSLSTGSEKNQTYLSAGTVNSRGVIPNNSYDRYNFSFRNTTKFLKDKLTLDVGANYVIQKDRNMITQGTYNNPLLGAYIFPRSNDWEDIKMYERWDESRRLNTQYWPVGDAGMTMQNPYWINYRNLRENKKDRYMLNAGLSYEILDWLSVSGRVRMDNSQNDYTEKMYATSNTQLTEGSTHGLYGITSTNDRQIYADGLININKTFGDDWSVQANIGASLSDLRSNYIKVRGPIRDGVVSDEPPTLANVFVIQNLANSAKTQRQQEGWREQTQSVFFSGEVGFKGAYFLTVTGRNDWPSQLAGPHSVTTSYFYPSVGASVVLSQIIPNMPKNLSYVKLRASYASVGVAFSRNLANPLHSWSSSDLGWGSATEYPIYDLRPERTKSFEVGLTMRFLRHFNFDFSYYSTNTNNQTIEADISSGSGSSKIKIQTGNVLNRGVELALGYKNTWGKFSWDSYYTLSSNKNKIKGLVTNVLDPETGEVVVIDQVDKNGLGEAHFLLREGGTLGDLYSLIDLKRDSNGAIYMDEKGSISTEGIKNSADYIKLGSVLPDANMSWRNDFRVKNFNFGFMLTARLGGVVFSRTQALLDYYGVSEASALARDNGGVMINGNDLIDANKWYSTIGGGTAVPQQYTYSATNVRLQEASIGYTIPKSKLSNICEITVSLVGRNLWMIYNKAPYDPETIASASNSFYQGIDYFMMPSMRNVGFNVRLKF